MKGILLGVYSASQPINAEEQRKPEEQSKYAYNNVGNHNVQM